MKIKKLVLDITLLLTFTSPMWLKFLANNEVINYEASVMLGIMLPIVGVGLLLRRFTR